MSEQRFNIKQQYREKFYQLPKVFFTNDKYMKLSNDAKIAYALLKDRLELSIKNNWFDESGDIFFIYTNEKLKTILNCQNAKLIKIKNELIKADLLEQIRCGQGKPNKLYLMNPAITKKDIYKIKKQEETAIEHCHDNEVRKSNFKKYENQTSRNSKTEPLEVRKSNTNDTDFSNTDFNDTNISDTTTNKKQSSGSSSVNQRNWIKIIQNELSIDINSKYKNQLSKLLSDFNNDVISYAIEYTSIHAKNSKPFLMKILQEWKNSNIKTVEQAKEFKVNKNVTSFSREKTPQWLTEENNQEYKKENDKQFEKDRKAFIEKLKEDWGE
ncbi:replication initiator protein A [Staphylococcus epidermidis]|uniref:replication initiator protein A n=1 Tax=Staphylococcus epidermidis TaxID=1282 RepID=UPI000E05077A|nr:replication initiator protein A [Staphylococcus epidermidis]SUM23252.1 Replication initiator protein [Staphylococcus epidermidis]